MFTMLSKTSAHSSPPPLWLASTAHSRDKMSVADTIRRKLTERFAPTRLDVEDQSHLHIGHEGARPGGETHFAVTIAAAAFIGQSRVARQRLGYQALAAGLATPLHALSLTTLAPDEDTR